MDGTHPTDPSGASKRIEGLPKCSLLAEANFYQEKPDFGVTAAIKQQRQLFQVWGRSAWLWWVVCGYSVTMLTMEVVGNGGGGQVEGFGGGGKGKRNGWHQGDHR